MKWNNTSRPNTKDFIEDNVTQSWRNGSLVTSNDPFNEALQLFPPIVGACDYELFLLSLLFIKPYSFFITWR